MAPPKKDAFADLFLSATASSSSSSVNQTNKLSLAERQTAKPPSNTSNSWLDLDVLSSRQSPIPVSASQPISSNVSLTSIINDPFDIFTKPIVAPPPQSSAPQRSSGLKVQPSLLDDDFIDAFTPEPQLEPEPAPSVKVDPEITPRPASTSNLQSKSNLARPESVSKDDSILAELVDIGFPVDVSNHAIATVGPNLQACVNFIMNGGKSLPSVSSRPSSRSNSRQQEHDLGSTINELSSDLLSKATFFYNKSKKTVLKNIEQLQQGPGHHGGREGPDDNLPAWMRNQHKYKKDAVERKQNGEKFEDYGSDDENINREEINRYMESQKQRDREKQKQRMDNFKEAARKKMNSIPNQEKRGPQSENRGSYSERPSSRGEHSIRSSERPSPRGEHSLGLERPSSSSQIQRESRSSTPTGRNLPCIPTPEASVSEDNLLDMGPQLSRAERFRMSKNDDDVVVSRRRRPASVLRSSTASASPSIDSLSPPPTTSSDPLNAFQQSDFEVSKAKATDLFTNGDYDSAHNAYLKCLEALPTNHELRIIIYSNLALTSTKTGSYKQAREFCDLGMGLVGEGFKKSLYTIKDKTIKSWYVKLLSRKAESLEQLESYKEALDSYLELVSQFGVTDKKVMDGRRRVNNILNPPVKAPTPMRPPTVETKSNNSNEALKRIRDQNEEEKRQDELKFKLHDEIQGRLFQWSNGKEDNLRSLLMSLPSILPERLGFTFITTKKITLNDLMLPKKVKINYMKVISSIHPDKLGKFQAEDKMICQGVFVILNKAWDNFKDQNGIS